MPGFSGRIRGVAAGEGGGLYRGTTVFDACIGEGALPLLLLNCL